MSVLPPPILKVFGSDTDPIRMVERRARELLIGQRVIVWEGDPQTFAFGYVSDDAVELLGHSVEAWTGNPTFWQDTVCHAEDRDDAVAYCALATAKACDHVFEYRAVKASGEIVWLRDYVRVVMGPKVPAILRGIMVDISEGRTAADRMPQPSQPSVEQLQSM